MNIRRYEVREESSEVKERVLHSIGNIATIGLLLDFADVYDKELPLPSDIQHLEVAVSILRVNLTGNYNLKALGRTSENALISLLIPSDLSSKTVAYLKLPSGKPKEYGTS